jgi:hypothetical protein
LNGYASNANDTSPYTPSPSSQYPDPQPCDALYSFQASDTAYNLNIHEGITNIESTKLTHALAGTTFVQPNKIDWDGTRNVMFVFAVR